MRHVILLLLLALPLRAAGFDEKSAERFANLALACVNKEYPNKISHNLSSDKDVAAPRNLTPAFYGCYDWHSSVHGHWLLARLARTFPNASFAGPAREALRHDLTKENIAEEVKYLEADGRASFERPYGLAWLLQLGAELREWDDPAAKELAANLAPLEAAAKKRITTWLPKLTNPIRIGEHNQTAFSLGLMIDAGRVAGDEAFVNLLTKRAQDFYLNDKNCPIAWEPSGEDFLSPCIAEADLMRRVLPPSRYGDWLRDFLPSTVRLSPAVVTDPGDPKLAHLDGLNLSRAWMLEGIASGLLSSDPRVATLQAVAAAHRAAGLAAVTGAHYEGGHWLGSFAVYLTTRRGISAESPRSNPAPRRE